MEKTFDIHEAVYILNKHYITDSPQMVSRWIRGGKLQAYRSENRKDGWKIYEDDLYEFIDEKNPGIVEVIQKYEDCVFGKQDERPAEKSDVKHGEEEGEKTSEVNKTEESIEDTEHDNIQFMKKLDDMDKTLRQVVELLKETIDDLRGTISSSQSPKQLSSTQHFKKSFSQFKEDIKKEVDERTQRENEEAIREVYDTFYDENEELKTGIVTSEDKFFCPITKDEKSQLLRILKKAVKELIEANKLNSKDD